MEQIDKFSKYRGTQGIYAIINTKKTSLFCESGTPYVGQSRSRDYARRRDTGVGNRLSCHRSELRRGKHHNLRLQYAWDKYGEESFSFFLLEKVGDEKILTEREQFWMDKFDAYETGYNSRPKAEDSSGHKRKEIIGNETLKFWIVRFFENNGSYPHSKSGIIDGQNITWAAIDADLINGWRGFDGGICLSDYIMKEFGFVSKTKSNKYSKSIISEWIEKFYCDNGFYPTKRSGFVKYAQEDGFSSINWAAIDACLFRGQKGLVGGTTLNKFIQENAVRQVKFKNWYNGEK